MPGLAHATHPTHTSAAPAPSLGSIEILTGVRPFDSSRHSVPSKSSGPAQTQNGQYILLLVHAGSVRLNADGNALTLPAGHAAMFCFGSQLSLDDTRNSQFTGLIIPAFMIETRLRNVRTVLGQSHCCASSPWRIIISLVRSLAREIRLIPQPLAYAYSSQLAEFVCLAFETETTAAGSAKRGDVYELCKSYIRSHASDPDLTPRKVADALCMSVRYLHKIFHGSDDSVCKFLRSTRLDLARSALANPQTSRLQIREVAYRCGFRSQTHFSSAFKQRFQISASEWRDQVKETMCTQNPVNG